MSQSACEDEEMTLHLNGTRFVSLNLEGISSVNHLLNITDSSLFTSLLSVFPVAYPFNSRPVVSVLKNGMHRQQDFLLRLVFASCARTTKFSRGMYASTKTQDPFAGFFLLWCRGAFLKFDIL